MRPRQRERALEVVEAGLGPEPECYNPSDFERRPNELILEVVIPRPASICGAAFLRIGRTPTDIALLNAVALVEVANGHYQRVRLALGGVNMSPVRLWTIEKRLEGQAEVNADTLAQTIAPVLQTAMTDFSPPSDFRAGSDYRRTSGQNLAFRALEEAINIARLSGVASSNGGM